MKTDLSTVRLAWQAPAAPKTLPRYPAAPPTDDRSTVVLARIVAVEARADDVLVDVADRLGMHRVKLEASRPGMWRVVYTRPRGVPLELDSGSDRDRLAKLAAGEVLALLRGAS